MEIYASREEMAEELEVVLVGCWLVVEMEAVWVALKVVLRECTSEEEKVKERDFQMVLMKEKQLEMNSAAALENS